jgi:eukaryotic-like serine/threonine-protein kinase
MTTTQTTCQKCGGRVLAGDRFCAHCGATQEESYAASAAEEAASSAWEGVLTHLREAIGTKYEIGRALGYGGMAAVFLAREIKLNRRVAIKVMSPSLMLAPGMIERFHREAVTVAALNHPNIVTIYTVEETDKVQYFVMKFVAGPSLEAVIRKDGPLPISVVRVWLTQVAGALGYAHRRGVVHRDIKPANILLDDEGNAVVTDFGIAKVAREPSLTQVGATVGTPAYMSPEQCQSRDITAASDQYSLGIVLYEMLTGEPPFTGPSLEVMQAHVQARARPISVARPDCPRDLQSAIFRMISKDALDRWPSMEDVVAAVGGSPLAHDDPIRQQLAELAGSRDTALLTPVPSHPPVSKATPTRVASLQIRPERRVLRVGRSARFQTVVRGTDGGILRERTVRWTSSDPAVVEVSADGAAQGLTPGEASITAICEGGSGSAAVEVRPPGAIAGVLRYWWVVPAAAAGVIGVWQVAKRIVPPPQVPVAAVAVTPATASVTVGSTVGLAATLQAADGRALTGRPVSWRSSDSTVASVTGDGTVTGQKAGVATVTASVGGTAGTAQVIVAQRASVVVDTALTSLSVVPNQVRISTAQRFGLRAVARDAGGRLVRRPVQWASSRPAVATVSGAGLLTGVAPGTAEVTATSGDVRSAPAAVTVVPAGPAPPGILQVLIVPTWAYMSVNGLMRGQNRLTRYVDTLPSGRAYRLHFEREGFVSVDTTLTLQPGPNRLTIQMRPRTP